MQLGLFHAEIPCAFGLTSWSGEDHCERCHEYATAMCAQFDQDVAAGKFDSDGFTPNERKAQQRRLHACVSAGLTP